MHDQSVHERDSSARRRASPSSSRMLTNYLADIELLLEEQRWEAAVSEAMDLPNIAVALEQPHLRSSGDRIKAWCEQWIRSGEEGESDANVERVCQVVCERTERAHSSQLETVPSIALRRLRLRRLSRTPPRGFKSEPLSVADPMQSDSVELCSTLVEATRRWYAQSACHDGTVQANLARLAVLR
jgi:hypothetical protein